MRGSAAGMIIARRLMPAVPTPSTGARSQAVPSPKAITDVLVAHRNGESGAFNELVELVYPELRRVARRQLNRWRPGASLDTTGLIHEAYLKLVDQTSVEWRDRGHFFGVCALAMRQIIVDFARRRNAQRRGAAARHVNVDEREIAIQAQAEQILILNELLDRLEAKDPRLLRVVECRFFGGYSESETAEALQVSSKTVERDWLRAKAWLRAAMEGQERR